MTFLKVTLDDLIYLLFPFAKAILILKLHLRSDYDNVDIGGIDFNTLIILNTILLKISND